MTFANGVTASVQFGPGNYCQHHTTAMMESLKRGESITDIYTAPQKGENWKSQDAEVAAWDKDGEWITEKLEMGCGDDVIGYLSAEKVLEFLNKAAGYVPNEHKRVILFGDVKGG